MTKMIVRSQRGFVMIVLDQQVALLDHLTALKLAMYIFVHVMRLYKKY